MKLKQVLIYIKAKQKNNYQDFRDPTGEFNKNRYAAHKLLEQKSHIKRLES